MVYLQDTNSSTGSADRHPNANPHTADNPVDAVADLAIGDAARDGGEAVSLLSEGRTFTVDPNLLAPWDAGYGGAEEEHETSENAQESHQEASNQIDTARDETLQLPAAGNAPTAAGSIEIGVGAVKKKSKNKKKPKSKRGLTAPTGFEEFYVDAPLTPAEHEVEKGLYDPIFSVRIQDSLAKAIFDPTSRRIEVAIQRYCARRNMDSSRKDVFDKYLALGGISAGPKQFSGGLDTKAMSDMSAADIALMKATHFVDTDKHGGEEAFVVDFEACAKAFFSSRLPQLYYLSSINAVKDVQAKTNVIRNFLNYLLHHDVCPEYKDQVLAARAACDLTDKELPMTMKAQSYLPGDFQTACSELFGGVFQGTYAKNPDWAPEAESYAGISPEVAQKTFRIGLATQVSDEVARHYKEQNAASKLETTKVYNACMEVIALVPADDGIKRFYEKHKEAKGLSSLGRLKAKSWDPPFKPPKDLTEEEKLAEATSTRPTEIFEFLVEDSVLETCFVGMKFEATVHDLSFGLKFFDNISGVFCSFYGSIPNERLIGWRVPEDEPLPPREKNMVAPASAEDLGVEEQDMANPAGPLGDNADGEEIEEGW
ncbi:MAG: hypothetical protein Q9186_004816 [Xanthomendoza sp. 1 TL-2023]